MNVMTVFGEMTKALSAIVLTTFGEPVVFHLEGQGEAVDASTGVAVSTVQPVLEVRQADLPATPSEGDAVSVQGVLYLIVDVRADGHGFLKLMLHKGGTGHETSSDPDP